MNKKKNLLDEQINKITDRLNKLDGIKIAFNGFFYLYIVLGILFILLLPSLHANRFLKTFDAIFVPIVLIPGIISIKHIGSLIKENKEELKIKKTEKDAELQVQKFLKDNLTEDYHVFANILTAYGDIDAVVVGPTGVYAVEIKSNSGTISIDDNGHLTVIDGNSPRKNYRRQVIINSNMIKRILDSSTSTKSFVWPVLVFPFADVIKDLVLTSKADKYKVPVLGMKELVEYIYSNKQHLLSNSLVREYSKALEEVQKEQE